MHIRIEKEEILRVIDHVEGIVERRNTIPILSNIMMQTEGDKLTITATDLDTVVSDSISGVAVEDTGITTVNSSTFAGLIRKMPSKSMIDMKVENDRMTIRSGRIRYQIPVLKADDFPLSSETKGEDFTIPVEAIVRAFKLVKDSMSTEETRYYLNGSYLAIEDGNLVAVATDGHRLSIAKILELNIDAPQCIVPRKAVNELIKILPDFDGDVSVRIDERSIQFQLGELVFRSKLVDGTYPDYTRVVPGQENIRLVVDPKVLQEAIERVTVVSHEKTNAVKLMIEADKITIMVTSPDYGSAQEEVAAESNAEITAGYNGKYLRDILSSYSSHDKVIMTLRDATSPALFQPENVDIDRSVLMPMRI